jgi:ABC-type sugar transport system ATPase subunit
MGQEQPAPVLQVRGIKKRFGGVEALKARSWASWGTTARASPP